jgi:hypothetical protein
MLSFETDLGLVIAAEKHEAEEEKQYITTLMCSLFFNLIP